ncbi:hypothetical protein DFH06DRAFT_322156 [Mycena polygramma]|nr:hypothetical protein DFH06DRAFT_322156 [Mycena polygramma]
MVDIPVELLQAIVDWVEDTPVLFNLRLASRTFNAIATPRVFGVLTVRDSVQSAEGLVLIQNGLEDTTTDAIQEIVFQGDPKTDHTWRDEEVSGETGRQALCAAFSGLAKFRNLKILRFQFYHCFREFSDEPSHFLLLQQGLFEALAAHPPLPLDSLTLYHIISAPDNIYTHEGFQNIFRPLTTLSISVLSENQSGNAYLSAPLGQFWGTSIPSMLMNARCLTSLSLRTNYPVGVVPALPITTIDLPALTALSLYNFVLDPSSAEHDILEFVVRHKATLTHLKLSACEVFGGEARVYQRPWDAVLRRLETELYRLRSFQLMENDRTPYGSYEESRGPFGYLFLVDGHHYHADDHAEPGEDRAALKSLMSTVAAR